MNRYVILLAVLAFPVAVGLALATPPSNVAGTFLARGTLSDPLVIGGPRHAKERRWTDVRSSDERRRFKRVKPIIACSSTTRCDVVVQSLVLQPGGTTGWHSHPGVLTVAVKAGSVTRYEAQPRGCLQQSYGTGLAFAERGAEHVILVRNEAAQPAELLITYVVPAGTSNAGLRLDQPLPEGCPA